MAGFGSDLSAKEANFAQWPSASLRADSAEEKNELSVESACRLPLARTVYFLKGEVSLLHRHFWHNLAI